MSSINFIEYIAPYYFKLIILVGFHCWLLSWIMFFKKQQRLFPLVFAAAILLVLLQTSYFVIWGLQYWLQSSMIVFFCAFAINLAFIFIIKIKNEIYWTLVLSGFVFFLLILSFVLLKHRSDFLAQQLVLQKILLFIHVVFFIFTYLIFSIVFITSIFFLICDFQLKQKRVSLNRYLPSISTLQSNNSFLINIGFFCLSVAIFLSLFIGGSNLQQNFFLTWNLRLLLPIFFWFIYGIFILWKNFYTISHSFEAKINMLLYFFAIVVFFYETRYLI